MAELKIFSGGAIGKWWAAQSKLTRAAMTLGVPAAGALALFHRKGAAAAPAAQAAVDPNALPQLPSDFYSGYAGGTPGYGAAAAIIQPVTSAPSAGLSAHQAHLLHMAHVAHLGQAPASAPASLSPHQLHLLHMQHLAHIGGS